MEHNDRIKILNQVQKSLIGSGPSDLESKISELKNLVLKGRKPAEVGETRDWASGKHKKTESGWVKVTDDEGTKPPPPEDTMAEPDDDIEEEEEEQSDNPQQELYDRIDSLSPEEMDGFIRDMGLDPEENLADNLTEILGSMDENDIRQALGMNMSDQEMDEAANRDLDSDEGYSDEDRQRIIDENRDAIKEELVEQRMTHQDMSEEEARQDVDTMEDGDLFDAIGGDEGIAGYDNQGDAEADARTVNNYSMSDGFEMRDIINEVIIEGWDVDDVQIAMEEIAQEGHAMEEITVGMIKEKLNDDFEGFKNEGDAEADARWENLQSAEPNDDALATIRERIPEFDNIPDDAIKDAVSRIKDEFGVDNDELFSDMESEAYQALMGELMIGPAGEGDDYMVSDRDNFSTEEMEIAREDAVENFFESTDEKGIQTFQKIADAVGIDQDELLDEMIDRGLSYEDFNEMNEKNMVDNFVKFGLIDEESRGDLESRLNEVLYQIGNESEEERRNR